MPISGGVIRSGATFPVNHARIATFSMLICENNNKTDNADVCMLMCAGAVPASRAPGCVLPVL